MLSEYDHGFVLLFISFYDNTESNFSLILQFKQCQEVGARTTDIKEQQCQAHDGFTGEHVQCGRMEETTIGVQGREQ